jgi:hypothetical protein
VPAALAGHRIGGRRSRCQSQPRFSRTASCPANGASNGSAKWSLRIADLHRANGAAGGVAVRHAELHAFQGSPARAVPARVSPWLAGSLLIPAMICMLKVRGRNRVTGNLSARSRPLAPPQHRPRIAIADDFPRGAARGFRDTTPDRALCKPHRKAPPSPAGRCHLLSRRTSKSTSPLPHREQTSRSAHSNRGSPAP